MQFKLNLEKMTLFAGSIQGTVIFTLHGEFLVVSKYFSALERASIILEISEEGKYLQTSKYLGHF
jgi:hypothetical protein